MSNVSAFWVDDVLKGEGKNISCTLDDVFQKGWRKKQRMKAGKSKQGEHHHE
jgi:hypothetical protein